MTTLPVPAEVSHVRVYLTNLSIVATDASDADTLPDWQPAVGSVTLAPLLSTGSVVTTSSGRGFVPLAKTFTLDATGSFEGWVLNSADADLSPSGWSYRVTVTITSPSATVIVGTFTPGAATTDANLLPLLPVSSSTGGDVVIPAGIPAGGTTGQALVKASDADFDVEWAPGGTGGGGGGVTDHGALSGLADDDHTQYALADGSRGAFAAPLGADDNYVTDAEKAALHSHSNLTALNAVSGTNTGDQDLSGLVPNTRTVNGKPLSANVTLNASDVGAATPQQVTDGDTATLSAAQSHAQALVDALTAASPATLDTLAEIAAALGADPNFAATMTAALAARVRFDAAQSLTVGEQAQARSNIGAGTSSFSGAYSDLSSKPTLGTAAAEDTTAFAATSHTHAAADIDSGNAELGSMLMATGGGSSWFANVTDARTYLETAHESGAFFANTVSASGAARTLAIRPAHRVVMNANCTFTFTNPTFPNGTSHAFFLHLSGAFTPTFPASVSWVGGSAPTYTSTGPVYRFLTLNGGTTWLGWRITQFSGDYADLTGKPTLGTAAATASTDYATAAQGAKADSALQPATPQAINAQTGAYTLVASDAGKMVKMTLAAAADLTVPANVFTAGQRVDIADRGTARVTVVAGSGMTINPPAGGSLVMEGQYSAASLFFWSATEADLIGLVAAS